MAMIVFTSFQYYIKLCYYIYAYYFYRAQHNVEEAIPYMDNKQAIIYAMICKTTVRRLKCKLLYFLFLTIPQSHMLFLEIKRANNMSLPVCQLFT